MLQEFAAAYSFRPSTVSAVREVRFVFVMVNVFSTASPDELLYPVSFVQKQFVISVREFHNTPPTAPIFPFTFDSILPALTQFLIAVFQLVPIIPPT